MSLTSTCSTTWWLSLLFSRSKSVLERSKHLHRRPLRSWVGPSFSAAKVRRLVEGKMTVRQGLSAAINIGDSPYFVIDAPKKAKRGTHMDAVAKRNIYKQC